MKKAKKVCATANVDQPFMCIDLAYISILLIDGYGLNTTTKIDVSFYTTTDMSIGDNIEYSIPFQLYKKVDKHEMSWALGCAYNLLTGISRKKK